VVSLEIGVDCAKHPLGLDQGSTEDAIVVTALSTGLREQGLNTARPIPIGFDGAKAPRAAVTQVFDHPVVQRRHLHRLRNVADKLTGHFASKVTKQTCAADQDYSSLAAQAQLEALVKELKPHLPRRGRQRA